MITEPEQQKLPLPALSAEEHKFVDAYIECRDIGNAAIAAGLPKRLGPALYRRQHVHDEIAERMKNVSLEVDKLVAKRRIIEVDTLDAALMEVVSITPKQLNKTPSLATPKVNAIELGYRRVGMLIDDNFIPDGSAGPAQAEADRIYRPVVQATMITHTVKETREVTVTTRADEKAAPPPKTIDASDPAWDNF